MHTHKMTRINYLAALIEMARWWEFADDQITCHAEAKSIVITEQNFGPDWDNYRKWKR
jgi:hypothetical protein